MKAWPLVAALVCVVRLCDRPARAQLEKWSLPDDNAAAKRMDDWVPITTRLGQRNLEPNEAAGTVDEIGSLLNPPAVPSGRAFNFNAAKQNHFDRAPAGEPYEVTTPSPPQQPALSGQFFSQPPHVPKIPQPVHFPVPFFNQPNPFQTRFQAFPPGNFQPQFTFVPQPQPKDKVTFPESPFVQQQNKATVQLVYVPIEAIQRQKPRAQADRPVPQQTQLDATKAQSPFETGKLKFQRPPPQPFDPSRFTAGQQFEQEPGRFVPPATPFEQNAGRFPPPRLFEQEKSIFPNQVKDQRPEFFTQNEQPVAPQSYMFLEDARNPTSNFFQFHDNRFQKPAFDGNKESKPPAQQSFVTNFDENRQESAQNFVSNFNGNPPRQEPPQNIQPNFQETRPRQEERPQNIQTNFQETRPRQEERPQNIQPNFQETRPRQEERPQNIQQNFQETTLRQQQQQPSPQFIPKFEQPKLEPQQQQFVPNFQETRPRQEPPQFATKFEQPKLEAQQQFNPNFQETRPPQEPSQPQFVPKFEESKLELQQQFVPNFQDIPQQEAAQQTFTPNFESLKPKPEAPQNFAPHFQETRPKQESQQSFLPTFEEVNPKLRPNVQLPSSTTSSSQQTFNTPSSTEQIAQTTTTPYPPPHQPPLSVYMEKRLDNKINEVLTILKDAKTIPVLDTIGNRAPKVFVGPSDLDAPRGYVKFELPYLSSLDITKIDTMIDRLPFFVAPLNFKPPFGYAKIPFPPPHIGSVVVSSKSPAVVTSTEFVPLVLTSQLPTEVNSLQPSISSTTQRGTDRAQQSTDVTPTTPKRNRQRKPLHRGSLTSFSTSTPINDVTEQQRDPFTTPVELQRLPESSPSLNEQQQQQQQFIESTPTPARPKFSRKPVEQQTVFETTPTPIQQNQQQFDNPPPHQFITDQQVPQTQQNYLDTLPQLTQPQFYNNQPSPSQQPSFVENQQQFLDTQPQIAQEQIPNNAQSLADINNPETNQQQFISSSTEKEIFKNFQQVQPLSQYQVGNNFVNQQPSSTEQVQSISNTPQPVSNEPQTETTLAPTETPKLRQRLSYYDKLLLSSTQSPVEITSTQNAIETSEKPRERPKLRARHRLTTTRKPAVAESSSSEELPEQVSESTTQRYNPLKRRRPISTTTTSSTTEQNETTRSSLRSRTTQANRSDFVRSRSRRPTTTTTTTTSTTTVQPDEENGNDVQASTDDEKKKIEEAASFWNEPVTIQQSHGYELDTRYTPAPITGSDGKFSSGEPPEDNDFSKEKYGGNEKKAHDPNSEKKGTTGRRGHWVRVRVKKPQDNLDTAESQNSLGPISANAIQELATKPTTESDGESSSSISVPAMTTVETTTPTPSTTTTIATTTTTTTSTTTVASPPPTTVFDNGMEAADTTDEHPAETTMAPPSPSPSAAAKYPDDEQDEAFQRNLADMLAKFIGGGNEPRETTAATAVADDATAETQYAGSDTELTTVTPPAVTEVPAVPVTSTTTKVSMETEICYRGRCVKSKKNKQITDLVPEP